MRRGMSSSEIRLLRQLIVELCHDTVCLQARGFADKVGQTEIENRWERRTIRQARKRDRDGGLAAGTPRSHTYQPARHAPELLLNDCNVMPCHRRGIRSNLREQLGCDLIWTQHGPGSSAIRIRF